MVVGRAPVDVFVRPGDRRRSSEVTDSMGVTRAGRCAVIYLASLFIIIIIIIISDLSSRSL